MQFQDRVKTITKHLNDFLRLYKMPEHLDDEGALNEIGGMAEAMNGLIPTSFGLADLEGRISDALRYIRQTYKGRSWPTVAHMVEAMERMAKRPGREPVESDAPGWQLDPLEVAAQRMNDGQAVGDGWLYGRQALRLMQSGLVDAETMQKYRSALYFAAKKAVGEDLARRFEDDWRQRHAEAERLAS